MNRLALGSAFAVALLAGCGDPIPDSPPASETTPASAPWFEDVARSRGLDFVHRSGHEGPLLFPEIMGGGAALFDMDDDGDLDAYLVQSGSLHRPGSDEGRNRLFVNVGGGRFEDRTAGSGAGDTGYGNGVTTGDYDNDGDVDLYVTNYGPNALLRNEGDGRFEDRTAEAGVGDPSWGTSASFLDYDRDGDLDLFVANYVDWSPAIELDCFNTSGTPDYCLPTNYTAPAVDRLYRNEGDGTFTDVTVETGVQTAFGNGLGVVVADFDGDGWPDIFVANDTNMNQLWINQEGSGFVDEALIRGTALDDHGMTKAGMGIVAEDVDDDGDPDVIVVNMHGQTDSFFRNEGGQFVDRTGSVGLATTSRRFTRFGIGLIDFDNDGILDFYQANGGVIMAPDMADAADPFAELNLLHRGTESGRFEEVFPRGGTAEELLATSRAAAFGDVDGDGGVDILIVNRDDPAYLLANIVPDRGNWIRIRALEENGRDDFGAKVAITFGPRTVHREVRSCYSYQAAHDPRVHVGLGNAAGVDEVTVRWLDGKTESFGPFPANQEVALHKGTPK